MTRSKVAECVLAEQDVLDVVETAHCQLGEKLKGYDVGFGGKEVGRGIEGASSGCLEHRDDAAAWHRPPRLPRHRCRR